MAKTHKNMTKTKQNKIEKGLNESRVEMRSRLGEANNIPKGVVHLTAFRVSFLFLLDPTRLFVLGHFLHIC